MFTTTFHAGTVWWGGSPRAVLRMHFMPLCPLPHAWLHLFLFLVEISSLVKGTAAVCVHLLVLILIML